MDTDIITIIDEAYDLKSTNHMQTRDGIVFSTKSPFTKTYILKPVQDDIERKLFVYLIHTFLYQNGFTNTDKILLTNQNSLTIEIDEQRYILSNIQKGCQCSAEDIQDIKFAAKLLADMHNRSEGFTAESAEKIASNVNTEKELPYVKIDLGGLQDLFEHRSKELVRLKKIALRRKNIFDYEYVAIADKYCNMANDACAALKESKYSILCEEYGKKGIICHKEYSPHNIIKFNDSEGGIINFDKASIDLPLFDIVNLIKRHMKKNGWDARNGAEIINEYSKIRNISDDEIAIIKIIFAFPQKLWRIVNKYYNSRRSWCEKSCLLKLSEIKKEREETEKFLNEITF